MIYTAAVLNENSGHLLRWLAKGLTSLEDDGFLFQTPQGNPLPHHMTVNLGAFDESLNEKRLLGCFVELHVKRLCFNYTIGACAAPVEKSRVEIDGEWFDLKTFNDHPHITTCLKPGVGAKFSNDLLAIPKPHTESVHFDRTYILDGWVKEVKPQKTYTR